MTDPVTTQVKQVAQTVAADAKAEVVKKEVTLGNTLKDNVVKVLAGVVVLAGVLLLVGHFL